MSSTFGNLESTTEWLEVVFNIIVLTSGLLLVTMLIGNIKVMRKFNQKVYISKWILVQVTYSVIFVIITTLNNFFFFCVCVENPPLDYIAFYILFILAKNMMITDQ